MDLIPIQQLLLVYFIYGLTFYTLGLAVAMEAGHASRSRLTWAMGPLAVFGLAHGAHEWYELLEHYLWVQEGWVPPSWVSWGRVALLAFSFASLMAFGVRMLSGDRERPWDVGIGAGVSVLYLAGVFAIGIQVQHEMDAWLLAADAWTRYLLGIPGALLTAAALFRQRRHLLRSGPAGFSNDLLGAAISFGLYGLVGQLFVHESAIFPSTWLNQEAFLNWFGFPIQMLRAALAVFMTWFMLRALRIFEVERQQQLVAAEQQAREAIARRDQLRGELLYRVVSAQEEERARLARELHDDTLQVLTALSTGLMGAAQIAQTSPERLETLLMQLSEMSSQTIVELRRLIQDLRPSVLDDMGLEAALQWLADRMAAQYGFQVCLEIDELTCRLPESIETTLFRIAQEALTNVARHAQASQVRIALNCQTDEVAFIIEDDGVGFDPAILEAPDSSRLGWGLIGMRERTELAGGEFFIDSAPGKGTILRFILPQIPPPFFKEPEDERDHSSDVD